MHESWQGHRRGRGFRGGAPPWWPADETWPAQRGQWAGTPRRFRRRFAIVALLVVGALVSIGFAFGAAFGGEHGGGRRAPGGTVAIFAFIALVLIGSTVIASRRFARPVSGLLESADRIGAGDYDTRVDPRGPPEVRRLMQTFNAMAERLAATDTERRRFLADVTHELRTPLAILQSGIEAQLDGIHARDDAHLESLLDEARRLGHLVDDLHTLALLGANKLPLHREPTDPGALLDDAIAATAARAADKQLALDAEVAPGLPLLDIDPRRIRQVLDNLLANALRHTPAGGAITVSAGRSETDDGVAFRVTDTGPGIDPEQLRRVFDRFETSDDRVGSGLGLAIARDLVQAHGGRVDIETSERGTTVQFTLLIGPEG